MSTAAVNGLDLIDQSNGQTARARSEPVKDPQAVDVVHLESWLSEIINQPAWRVEADKCADFYDGNQLSAETVQKLEERGMGPLITNLIAPTVNAVLGMEAKTRTDWRVGADDDKWQDVAEALSAKMKEAERETQADRAISDAYAQQIKSGFGCVEVSRCSNPFDYRYRCRSLHRRELFWDWRSVMPDWTDARYVVRKRWYDVDQLVLYFPQHADLLRYAARGWRDWSDHLMAETPDVSLVHAQDQEARFSLDQYEEWRDPERGRIVCFEVWYRIWLRGYVLTLPGGRTVEFDRKNPMHVAVVATGMVQPHIGVYDKLRVAFFVGPHRMTDLATNRRHFPYVPFFGYREDLTGVPYGLVRSMLSPQEEINARMQRMMWLLSGRRAFVDSDAVDTKYNTISDVSRELSRSDAFVVTNPNAKHGAAGIRVDNNGDLSQFQYQLLQERKQAIQEAAGVYSAMMGQNSQANSGLAIQSLVEQGTTTLAEINDNYRMARRNVGDRLLELLREDMTKQVDILVDNGTAKRRVIVNIPRVDPATGQKYRDNDVQSAPVKMALEDVPSTPTYRAQQFAQLTEVTKSLPPQLQAFVVPFIMEASDLPRRRQLAELLRKQMGVINDPDSPEAKAKEAAAAKVTAAAQELVVAKAQADIRKTNAQADKLTADAQKAAAPTADTSLQKAQADASTKLEIAREHEAAETTRTMIQYGASDLEQIKADIDQLIAELNGESA